MLSTPENYETPAQRTRRWQEANRDRYLAYQRDYKRRKRAQTAKIKRLNAFKTIDQVLTTDQYDELWARQGGKCKICFKSMKGSKLVPNFNPETGHVRGLICVLCELDIRPIENYRLNPNFRQRTDEFLAILGSDSSKETGLPSGL